MSSASLSAILPKLCALTLRSSHLWSAVSNQPAICAVRWSYSSTPLGMGFGDTRFASPTNAFKLLDVAKTLATTVAETIVRDRFEGSTVRELTRGEIADWGVCEVSATAPLLVLDLRGNGCFKLGISTDIVGGKAQREARELSQELHDTTDLDGILYKSRLLKNQDCVAVYDRAVPHNLNSTPVVRIETLAKLVRRCGSSRSH